jgi:hypothetical protein
MQDRPREHGRFVSASGISHLQLTEAQIRPLMRYCRVSAAEMLKVSTYQLSMACSRLGLKWPRWPEVPTPEHHKALNRKRKKERIPKNATAVYYGEKEDDNVLRFFELRISCDGRTVFTRWGRPGVTSNYATRANRKTRFASREDALEHCREQKAEYGVQEGWVEKEAPELPGAKPKSKRKAMVGVQHKRKLVKEQTQKITEMTAANLVQADAHSQEEIDAATKLLESLRTKMHRAVRQAKGLVEATKEQRAKVAAMKTANAEKPGTHSEEELKAERHKLRELMCKYSKRLLVPPSELRRREEKAEAPAADAPGPAHPAPRAQPLMPPPAWPMPPPAVGYYPPPAQAMAQTRRWCMGSCIRLRKPWCTCPQVATLEPPLPHLPHAPVPMVHPLALWHYQHAVATWPRGLGPGGVYYGGWPFGPMQLRKLEEEEARQWPLLCLADGSKLPPAAVGVRACPHSSMQSYGSSSVHAGLGGSACAKTVSVPLYRAAEMFDRLVDPGLAPSAKKKKWERLWKTSKGKDGTLMDYALCVQNSPGGVAGGGGGSGGGAQSDALVSFNGVAVMVEAAGSEEAQQWLRDAPFFQHPDDAMPPEPGALGEHSSGLGAAMLAPHGQNAGDDLVRQALRMFVQAAEQYSAHEFNTGIARIIDQLRAPTLGAHDRGRDDFADSSEHDASAAPEHHAGGLHVPPPAL